MTGDAQSDGERLKTAFAEAGEALAGAVWLAAEPAKGLEAAASDPSLLLQNRVLSHSTLALAWNAWREGKGEKQLKLVLVAPGGAPVTEGASPVNAGLWTFARVLRNEFDSLDMGVVDTGPARNTPEIMLDHGLRLLSQAASNREFLADPESGAWKELRAVPGPLSPRKPPDGVLPGGNDPPAGALASDQHPLGKHDGS